MIEAEFEPGYATGPIGPVHYVTYGTGFPVVVLHQSPRSWRECRFLMSELGQDYQSIAVDLPGFGASIALSHHSIETYAGGVRQVLDHLGIDRYAIIGHHTGGIVATELCARDGTSVSAAVLSCTPFIGAAERAQRANEERAVDRVAWGNDDQHLRALWQSRADFYDDRGGVLVDEFVSDALLHGADFRNGHHAVSRYRMEERITEVVAPALLVAGRRDPYSFPSFDQLRSALPTAETFISEDGTFTMLEERAPSMATRVRAFFAATLPSHVVAHAASAVHPGESGS